MRGKRCATHASPTIQRDTCGAVRDLHGGLCKRPGRVPPGLGSGACVDKKTGTRAGEIPVEIAFVAQSKKMSALHIDKSWGVSHGRELEAKVGALAPVKAVTWE